MTTLEQERDAQRAALTCVCSAAKPSAFHAFCERCWSRLPWLLRWPVINTMGHTEQGSDARREAADWLKKMDIEKPKAKMGA